MGRSSTQAPADGTGHVVAWGDETPQPENEERRNACSIIRHALQAAVRKKNTCRIAPEDSAGSTVYPGTEASQLSMACQGTQDVMVTSGCDGSDSQLSTASSGTQDSTETCGRIGSHSHVGTASPGTQDSRAASGRFGPVAPRTSTAAKRKQDSAATSSFDGVIPQLDTVNHKTQD